MSRDSYRELRCPADTGRPLREELARLVCGFDAVAGANRTRRDYLAVADHILEFVACRAERAAAPTRGRVNQPPLAVNAPSGEDRRSVRSSLARRRSTPCPMPSRRGSDTGTHVIPPQTWVRWDRLRAQTYAGLRQRERSPFSEIPQ
jgi:hypothetical protein